MILNFEELGILWLRVTCIPCAHETLDVEHDFSLTHSFCPDGKKNQRIKSRYMKMHVRISTNVIDITGRPKGYKFSSWSP